MLRIHLGTAGLVEKDDSIQLVFSDFSQSPYIEYLQLISSFI